MKYYKLIAASLLLIAHANPGYADSNGEELYDQLCSACHARTGQPTVAPPVFGVVSHVKAAHPEKEGFVDYIVQWVANPDAEKALMPGAVRKFGLMPKLDYDAAKVRLIAEYLFDGKTEFPAWYIEHYKAEHGHEPRQ